MQVPQSYTGKSIKAKIKKGYNYNMVDEIWFLTSELEGERASSFRQERWCRIFLDLGIRLRVFNIRGGFKFSDEIITSGEQLDAFRLRGLKLYKGPKSSVREGLTVRLLRRVKHVLLADLFMPNVFHLFWHIHNQLRVRKNSVAIMASSPPFSLAVVGALLKRMHHHKVIFTVDMRDAWALHNALGGIRPLKKIIEKNVLRSADRVTTVSYGLADEFRLEYGVKAEVMYNVATHYLEAPAPTLVDLSQVCSDINPARRQLVYTGSTPIGHYDLESIVGGMVRLRHRNPNLADSLQLVFVGACDELRREVHRQEVLAGDIVFVEHLQHSVARSVQASAYGLIFLAHFGENNSGVVSTKLFEYLCLGKPVLPISLHKDSDVDVLLLRYCGRSLNVHNAEEISQSLECIADGEIEFLPSLKEVNRVGELVEDYRRYARELLGAPQKTDEVHHTL